MKMGFFSKFSTLIVSLGIGCAFLVGSLLVAVEIVAPPMYSTSLATVQNITAKSFVVFDVESGEVLQAYNENELLPIASITKLLVAPQVFANEAVWEDVNITIQDVTTEGRAGGLSVGDSFSVYTLLFPLLLESSNDAGATLERTVPELIEKTNTEFEESTGGTLLITDATGLSEKNIASAIALKNVLVYLNKEHRHLIDISKLPYRLDQGHSWVNNSPFVDDPAYRGGKHGYTLEAGGTALVQFTESFAYGYERDIGYVVLGSLDVGYDISLLRDYVHRQVQYR